MADVSLDVSEQHHTNFDSSFQQAFQLAVSTANKAYVLRILCPGSFDKIQQLSDIRCAKCQLSRWVQDTEASHKSPYAADLTMTDCFGMLCLPASVPGRDWSLETLTCCK